MNIKINAPENLIDCNVYQAIVSELAASKQPGLADFLVDFINREYERYRVCSVTLYAGQSSDELWSEFAYNVEARAKEYLNEII